MSSPLPVTVLPAPRGSLSASVIDRLRSSPLDTSAAVPFAPDDHDDESLALALLQHVDLRPISGVHPLAPERLDLLALRQRLEADAEARLRDAVGPRPKGSLPGMVRALLEDAGGTSLSRWMLEHGTAEHLREFAVHRAPYQLLEADPHTFALPRLSAGRTKAALLEIQSDEYGRHVPSEAHAALFATTMRALGLDPVTDLDIVPASTLDTTGLLHLLGRSRRLTGALVAHLAVFEMTSVEPMARYAAAVRRCLPDGVATEAARFYDVHVAADGYHEQLAVDELLTGLEEEHPDLAADAAFGAAALMEVEGRFTDHLVAAWESGRSSLRHPLPGSRLAAPDTPLLASA